MNVYALAVTGGTTRQYLPSLNAIFGNQITPELELCLSLVFRTPGHIENFFLWSHESLRRAMTLETPFHLQRCRLIRNRHLVDASVTGGAANAFVYVNAVVEIRVVGQVVYTNPLDWFPCAKARPHGLQIRTFSPDLFVTIHARGS